MKKLNQLITTLTLFIVASTSSHSLNADECCYNENTSCCYADNPGCGYTDCCVAPCISPTTALGAVALAAIVAVAVQERKNGHGKHGSGGSGHAHNH